MDTDLRQFPAYVLWRVNNAWQRAIRRVLEPWKLTHVQFAVMSTVERLGHSQPCVSQVHVVRFLDMDENMVSQVIRSLEERKLLQRTPHPTDRRAHQLSLTRLGVDVTLEARTVVRELQDEFFSPLGDQRDDLVRLLRTLIDPSEERPCPE